MTFDELRWEHLEWAWGFAAVFAVWAGFLARGAWRRRVLRRAGDAHLLAAMTASVSLRMQRIHAAIIVVAAALLVVALMAPKYGTKSGSVTNTGIDIVIAVDVSKSMLVRDVVPDRLAGARMEILSLLEKLSGGRVALVPFAGIPFVQCPLTSDFGVIRTYLEDLNPADMPVPGTAVARALRQSIAVLSPKEQEAPAKEGQTAETEVTQYAGSKHKAIVLFTDGEDHEGDIDKVVAEAESLGIQVFTVGVGTGSGNVVPILTEDGSEVGYMKQKDGKTPLISGLNEGLLRDVAEKTGGIYLNFSQRSIAADLYAEIDKLEKKEFTARFEKLAEDRYMWALWPAVILLLLELLSTDRKRRRAAAALCVMALGLGVSAPPAWAQAAAPAQEEGGFFFTTNSDIDEGNERLVAGDAAAALEWYKKAVASIPENAVLHYNLGLAQLALGQHEDAAASMSRALDQAPPLLGGSIRYALATVYARWGEALEKSTETEATALEKWKAAAAAFEAVLLSDPNHEDAKWNLELALLRVDPPCEKRNDSLEPNNTPEEAKALELQENKESGALEAKTPILLCPEDTDWLGLQLGAGDRLVVTATLTGDLAAEAKELEGAVELELVAPDGKTVLAKAERTPAGAYELTERRFDAETPALLRVFAPGDEERPVQVAVTVRPPCAKREDDLEDNDKLGAASTIPQNETRSLQICPGDDDWFEAYLGDGDSLFAFATAKGEHTEGFAMEITDAYGKTLSRGARSDGARVAAALEPGVGKYFIRVSGGETTEAPYELSWKVLPPCPAGNDPLEPNDKPSEAKTQEEVMKAALKLPATPGQPSQALGMPGGGGGAQGGEGERVQALLRICEGDTDFFEVVAKPDDPRVAQIVFDHGKGDLRLAQLDATGEKVEAESDQSTPERSAEGLALPEVKEETKFLLRVDSPKKDNNFYVLTLQKPPPPSDGQDQKQQDQNDSSEQEEKQQEENKQEEQKEQEKEPDPVADQLEQMDRNPENLEAKEAMRRSPMRNANPENDW
jgi:Ca-activated chloride channel family protein